MSTTTEQILNFFQVPNNKFKDEQVKLIVQQECNRLTSYNVNIGDTLYYDIKNNIDCELGELRDKYEVLTDADHWIIRRYIDSYPMEGRWTIEVGMWREAGDYNESRSDKRTFICGIQIK